MRVLHVLEAVEGGTALHVRTLAERQHLAADHVMVAAPQTRAVGITDRAFWDELQRAGIATTAVPLHSIPFHPANAKAASRLSRVIRACRPDVVHSHSTAAGAVARPVARRFGIASVHTPNGVRFSDERKTIPSRLELAIERRLARWTDRVVAVSASEARVLGAAHETEKIRIVPNGIHVSNEPPDPFPHRPRVVSVARLKYQKAPELTVRILAELRRLRPDVETLMVGDGARARAVQELRDRLDPGLRLAFGDVEGREAIRSSTVVLLTSRWEGAPYVPLEAMERSRPVVATDVVGSRDVVVDNSTGFLVPFGRVAPAVEKLVMLVDEPERARRMGCAGREHLISNFTIDQMVEKLRGVYEEALRGRR